MATDPFESYSPGMTGPASSAAVITPSDSLDLTVPPRALIAQADGTLRVTMLRNGAVVNFFLLAGVPLPIRVSRVHATGTTAVGIVGLW